MQTEINNDGLTDALLYAAKRKKERDFDHEVLVFMHLAKLLIGQQDVISEYNGKPSKEKLYRRITRRYYQVAFNAAVQNTIVVDEEPTDWMRAVYRDYKKWRKNAPKKEKGDDYNG